MAKGAYVGISGKARKIKAGYIGIETQTPAYEERNETASITANNISTYFDVTNGTYSFVGSGSSFTSNYNSSTYSASTATSTWTAKKDMSNVSLNWSTSASSTNTSRVYFTMTVAGTTVVSKTAGSNSGTWTGSLKAGESIVLTYYSQRGNNSSYRGTATISAISVTQTTTVQTGTTTASVARRIKMAYIGIGGKARPCWGGGGKLTYYGTITAMSTAKHSHAATTVGNYALFAGGMNSSGEVASVDAYNASLVRSTPTALSIGRAYLSATSVGEFALFGGGGNRSGATWYASVDAYNASLTRSTPTALSAGRAYSSATTVGNYALFAGGKNSSAYLDTVDAYNASLTRSTPTALSFARCNVSATTVGNYALFAGGAESGGALDTVDAYNASLTRSTPTALSFARASMPATTVGNYALFAGGMTLTASYEVLSCDTVDAYNTSLTRSTPTALSVARDSLAATQLGDYALFGLGEDAATGEAMSVVDAYDSSLVRSTPAALTGRGANPASATVGNYALFSGGSPDFINGSSMVEAYTIN